MVFLLLAHQPYYMESYHPGCLDDSETSPLAVCSRCCSVSTEWCFLFSSLSKCQQGTGNLNFYNCMYFSCKLLFLETQHSNHLLLRSPSLYASQDICELGWWLMIQKVQGKKLLSLSYTFNLSNISNNAVHQSNTGDRMRCRSAWGHCQYWHWECLVLKVRGNLKTHNVNNFLKLIEFPFNIFTWWFFPSKICSL